MSSQPPRRSSSKMNSRFDGCAAAASAMAAISSRCSTGCAPPSSTRSSPLAAMMMLPGCGEAASWTPHSPAGDNASTGPDQHGADPPMMCWARRRQPRLWATTRSTVCVSMCRRRILSISCSPGPPASSLPVMATEGEPGTRRSQASRRALAAGHARLKPLRTARTRKRRGASPVSLSEASRSSRSVGARGKSSAISSSTSGS
mmetsp:Transcript_85197/g.264718  ORF Transcript_85197/g.264718 Transcript_85197/m.264718 type:complete len:203 (-) Transcript_85197:269-877(-)